MGTSAMPDPYAQIATPDPYAQLATSPAPQSSATPAAASSTTPQPNPNAVAPQQEPDSMGRLPGETWLQGLNRRATGAGAGAFLSLEQGFTHIPGLRSLPGLQDSIVKDRALANANPVQGDVQIGSDLENLLEFMGGDAIATKGAKVLGIVDKMKQIGEIGKVVERYPGLAKVMGVAARQGAVGGAQTAAHGGTTEEIAHSAEIAAGMGGLGEIASAPLVEPRGSSVAAIAPTTRTIAGEEIPVLASQQPNATPAATRAATIANEPAYQAKQQQGSQNVTRNLAQRAVQSVLDEVNTGRTQSVQTDPAKLLPAPTDMQPTRFEIPTTEAFEQIVHGSSEGGLNYAGKTEVPNPDYKPEAPDNPGYRPGQTAEAASELGSTADTIPSRVIEGTPGNRTQAELGNRASLVPRRLVTGDPTMQQGQWQFTPPAAGTSTATTTGGGVLHTSDPQLAQATLTNLEDLIDSPGFSKLGAKAQGQVNDSAATLRQQLDDHFAYQRQSPNFKPVDANSAVAQTTDFRAAADQIESAVKPVYQRLDELSQNEFSALRSQEQAQLKIVRNPTTPEAYDAATKRLSDIADQQQQIFEDNKTEIAPEEWRAANTAWRKAQTLNLAHATIEGTANGISPERAASAGVTRQLKGGAPMFKRLTGFIEKPTMTGETHGDVLQGMIGKEGVDNLYQVADLLKTPEKASGFNKILQQTSMVLRKHGYGMGPLIGGALGSGVGGLTHHAIGGFEGMLAGAAAEGMYRRVLNRVATDPAVAQRVAYILNSGASIRNASPLLASTIMRAPTAVRMAPALASASMAQSTQDEQDQGGQK